MPPIINEIEQKMKDLIVAMSGSPDYNYDWQTVDEYDPSGTDCPSAWFTIVEEINIDDPDGAWAQCYLNEIDFVLRVRVAELSTYGSSDEDRLINSKDDHYKALDDLKKLFGTNYSLDDSGAFIIMYRGMRRTPLDNPEASLFEKDFVPGEMNTRWLVKYSQDRKNPEQTGEI